MPRARTPPNALPGEGRVSHWTAARKAEVLRRIRDGEIARGDAMRRWAISVEELDAWLKAERRAGQAGLKAKAIPPVQERLL